MNLIEAWKKAKEGQKIREVRAGLIIKKIGRIKKPYLLDSIRSSGWLDEDILLSDNWEIEKEKKKMVIEEVQWDICSIDSVYADFERTGFSPMVAGGFTKLYEKTIPTHTPMKMTLEWEE